MPSSWKLKIQLHLDMRNSIFQKFFRSLIESVLFIQRVGVNLRFNRKFSRLKFRFGDVNRRFHNFAAQPAPTFDRNDTAN